MTNKPPTHPLKTENWQSFLLKLRYQDTRLVKTAGNQPIVLNDPATAWLVYTGQVHVFAVPLANGSPAGARRHLFPLGSDTLLMGTSPQADFGLILSSSPETELLQVPLDSLKTLAAEDLYRPMVALLLDQWITALAQTVPQVVSPKNSLTIEASPAVTLPAGSLFKPRRGVLWFAPTTGESFFASRQDIAPLRPGLLMPISSNSWMQAAALTEGAVYTTLQLLERGDLWAKLGEYHDWLLACVACNTQATEQAELKRLTAREHADQMRLENALQVLASPLNPPANSLLALASDSEGDLLNACQIIGEVLRIPIKAPRLIENDTQKRDPLQEIARTSRFRTRRVALTEDWWTHDNGPLLGYMDTDKRPIALLPSRRGYTLIDPANRVETVVTPQVADTIDPFAVMFYRPMPEHPLTARDLLRYSLFGTGSDFAALALTGIAGGLLALATPLATAVIFNRIIPSVDERSLWLLVVVLIASAVATALFQLIRAIATLRIEGRVDGALQAAIWDRLLSLPVPFFRDYSAGDLGMRAMGISVIRQMLSGIVINSVLSGVFSVFSLFLLFYYHAGLALIAFALMMLVMSITLLIGYLQVRQQRRLVEVEGKLSGMVLQFINGISKFRVAGAEDRAFAYWSGRFADKKKIAYRVRLLQNWLITFTGVYPVITLAVLFAAVGAYGTLAPGDFLAFNVAFGQLILAGVLLSTAIITVLSTVPLYERLQPIVTVMPEVTDLKADPGELSGDIEVSHVSFRYRPADPVILQAVSLHIRPGEFVALVGPSGSGKSTLFRLLLGMEQPESGAIYLDSKDLAELDIQAVRRQMGIVLQNSNLLQGDILTNIIGSLPLTVDDAWAAARMAGLEDDIKALPMGMYTVISEGGGNFSGGQRQRLMIARAIANRPRIVFFDEATSALDNRTQAIVSDSLHNLNATRIVIAHRLSTILSADRIVVLDKGEIVQMGTYDQLVSQPGLFAELAKRQMV